MRFAFALILLASPAQAWEFTGGLPCLLTHEGEQMEVELTHDPTQPLFTITVTRTTPWPDEGVFSLRFEGVDGFTISTNRQQLSNQGRSLTVTDTGFSNVLRGLERNQAAIAQIGGEVARVSLAGAAAPVDAFRTCRVAPSV